MSRRAEAIAHRVARGHRELIAFVEALSDSAWRAECPADGRTVGVVVHHVASMLPLELDLVKVLAAGQPISGVTLDAVNMINDEHARANANCGKEETLDLLRQNSTLVVETIRVLTDAELDGAAPVSLHWGAPLTAQYFIEDHPLSHAYQHLASIRAALRPGPGS
jgi:hypothetical protein